jgi:ribonuclease E
VIVHEQPVEPNNRGGGNGADEGRSRRGRGTGRTRGRAGADGSQPQAEPVKPSPMALAGTKPHPEADETDDADLATDALEARSDEAQATEETVPKGDPVEAALMGTAPEPDHLAGRPVQVTWAGVPTLGTQEASAGSDSQESDRETAPEPVAAPIVVTSTRRRRAARPAGPPEASPEPAEVSVAPADADPDVDGHHDGDHGPSLVHVPVKKKGSRKR